METTPKRLFVAIVVALLVAVGVRQSAGASDANAQNLAKGLNRLANTVGQVADVPDFAQPVPMTDLAPLAEGGLRAADVMSDVVKALPPTFTDLDNLRAELEALDGDYGGVQVTVGCPTLPVPGCDAVQVTSTEISGQVVEVQAVIPLRGQRTVQVPVSLVTQVLDIQDGLVDVKLAFDTRLEIRLDTAEPVFDLDRDFALSQAPTLSMSATVEETDVAALGGDLGFTRISAGLDSFAASMTLSADFQDPDGDGDITAYELATTAAEDLFKLNHCVKGSGTLTLDSDLVPDAPDLSKPISDGTCGFEPPSLGPADLGDKLKPFVNITPDRFINGLGQAATAFGGAQALKDFRLPFINGKLSDVARAIQPLMDFVNREAVSCIVENESATPFDVYGRLPKGAVIQCQAYTTYSTVEAGSVKWFAATTAIAVENTAPPDSDGTVISLGLGSAPASTPTSPKHAKFKMIEDGHFWARVTYEIPAEAGTVLRTAEQPARTAQAMYERLKTVGGFEDPAPKFDPATQALTFGLKQTFGPVEGQLEYDFGDRLEHESGLIGLKVTDTAKVGIAASGITVDMTLGLLLVEGVEDIGKGQACPDPTVAAGNSCPRNDMDRVFVQVNPTGAEIEVENATFTAEAPGIEGRLGFLGVTATGDLAGGAALHVEKMATSEPLFRADIQVEAAKALKVGDTTLPNAVGLRWLLFNIGDYAQPPEMRVKADAKLKVEAKAGDKVLGTGTVTATWPDVTVGAPQVTVDGSFNDQLKVFDIAPNLFGSHSGTADASDLKIDPAAVGHTFDDTAVGKILENITDGSYCEVAKVIDAGNGMGSGLQCKETKLENGGSLFLGGGSDNDWDPGDVYRLRMGDPLAMLWELLDHIENIAGTVDGITGTGLAAAYGSQLPFVGVSAKELVTQFQSIRRAASELRGGPGPIIVCGTGIEAGIPKDGVAGLGQPGPIYCRVDHNKAATSVEWIGGENAAVVDRGEVRATVGNAAALQVGSVLPESAEIQISDPKKYSFQVRFTDDTGERQASFPSLSVPPTLQALEAAIEAKLGTGSDAVIEIDASTGQRRLKVGLGYRRCNDAGLCTDFEKNAPEVKAALNASLGSAGSLVGLNTNGQVSVSYDANARAVFAAPLSDITAVKVLPESKVEVKAKVAVNDLDLAANLGPLALVVGTRAGMTNSLQVGAKVSLTLPAEKDLDAFAGALVASAGKLNGGVDCGSGDMDGDGTDDTPLQGLACGKLSAGIDVAGTVTPVGSVCFVAESFDTLKACDLPPDLGAAVANSFLDWNLLKEPLPKLLERLRKGLSALAYAGSDEGAGGKAHSRGGRRAGRWCQRDRGRREHGHGGVPGNQHHVLVRRVERSVREQRHNGLDRHPESPAGAV